MVTPFNLINAVTISFAYPALTSNTAPLSASCDNAIAVSPVQFAISAHTRFKSSVQSSKTGSSSLFGGSMHTSSLICAKIDASSATTSTMPASLLWKSAAEVSHLLISFPSSALGAFTNSFAFFSSINVKSVSVGIRARPPPQLPKMAVICGITPELSTCFL